MTTTLDALTIERKSISYATRAGRRDSGKIVTVFLSQALHPDSLERRRTRLFGGDHSVPPSSLEVADYLRILRRIPPNADLVVMSEHSAASASLQTLQNLSTANRQVIVSALGFSRIGETAHNSVVVAVPDHQPFVLQKISFSAEDQEQANAGRLLRGNRLVIFELPIGRLCVLNCHEYTHAAIMEELARSQIDFLVVTSFNPAWQLYTEYARADIHRLFCFIILCNVGNYGGSSVLAPFSKLGRRDGAVTVGGLLFSARGPSDASATIDLPLAELRRLRRYRNKPNPLEAFKENADYYQPVVPPEVLLMTSPPYRKHLNQIEDVDLAAVGYRRRRKAKTIRIGVAQLRSPSIDDYKATSYNISRLSTAATLRDGICKAIDNVEADLDFLVLPEVFAPLGLDRYFREFAETKGTIVVTGVEYDPQKRQSLYGTTKARGANRCFVYVPTTAGTVRYNYTKMTRSQYDALSTRNKHGLAVPFEMDIGTHLLRFRNDEVGDFGVVICYDFSHHDLMHSINMTGRTTPLDLMFVVCHNPYEELYRMCSLADCHRYYQYIAMCNVSTFGGSGVFGPMRTKGRARTLLYAGKNTEGIFVADVDVVGLRMARRTSDSELTTAKQKREVTFQRRPGIFNVKWTEVDRPRVEVLGE